MTTVASTTTAMRVASIQPDDPRWRDALSARHDFYHLPGYAELESKRLSGNAFGAYVDEPGVRLLLPLVGREIPGGRARDVVSPYGYPSPVAEFDDPVLLRTALSAVVASLREQGFVSMFTRLHPVLDLPDDVFGGMGTLVAHGETVSIDLRLGDEEQWRGMRSRYRTFFNKTARLGHRVYFDDGGEHLDRFVALYLDTMRRQNAAAEYFFTPEYLRGLWERLRGHVHLGVVEVDGAVVCAGLFGESNGIIQYHLSGTAEEALRLSPLKLLINHARQWATRRGAETLHLGGGLGSADDSLMHFKAGFSNRRHVFKTWRVVLDDRRYAELSADAQTSDGYFPAYRSGPQHDS